MKQLIRKSIKKTIQYCLDRQITKISALSLGHVLKYEYLTDEYIFPEKSLLGKAATIKRCEYSPLPSELKKQAYIAKKQYQRLDKVYEFDQKKDVETINNKPTLKKCKKTTL